MQHLEEDKPPFQSANSSADEAAGFPSEPFLDNDPAAAPLPPRDRIDLSELQAAADQVRAEIGKLVVGQREFIDLLLASLLCGGHVLVEGVPGIAKTLTARLLAKSVQTGYSRIQFTPDLMPSDLTGTNVFNMAESVFTFNPGPLFSNIVLIDEINRAPAKTQAALFEVMEEKQVTVDGTTYPMEFPFFVIATQNPIEQEGTYKLPEAQLDRFIVRLIIDYPNLQEEREILYRFRSDFNRRAEAAVEAVLTPDQISKYSQQIEQLHIQDELLDYIAAIVHRSRNHNDLYLGASPRASLAILKMAKAIAAISGRDFVTPDDIQYVAFPVMNHRILLTPEREMEGYTSREVIEEIIQSIEVPR